MGFPLFRSCLVEKQRPAYARTLAETICPGQLLQYFRSGLDSVECCWLVAVGLLPCISLYA